MGLIILIFSVVLFFFSWIAWSILLLLVFSLAAILPWALWEGFMYLTLNNIINLVAKIPTFFGAIFGFMFALPFAIPAVVLCLWNGIQIALMGILVLNGDPSSTFAANYLTYVSAFESGIDGCMFIARFFYEHCQWLWGGSGIFRSYYFWQNGVWGAIGNELPVPMVIVKLFLLAIPYTIMFLIPLFPVLWSLSRPFVGALSRLPAISGNDDGR